MEVTAGISAAASGAAAVRGVSLPMSLRKEWRAVSEHHSVRNAGNEDLERPKFGQQDERTIYEVQQGREPLDVDFCSVTIDGISDDDILQQRLHSVVRHREELQQMEIGLRAQVIAKSEIIEMQTSFDAQIKERANAAVKLQEQLHEGEQTVHELERKMEEKDRELHTIKLDNEAAWAKEGLLREQNKELATFRRQRDHSEVERAQHIKKIHDLQEHIQEKERQLMELQEQHRVAQETILFKDERLREAQAWIARVQEMDALQSSTNHSLQAELRDRTEQYNQLWHGCQRQFAEMERVHFHTVQQLQLELADARERGGTYTDESRVSQSNLKDVSQFGQNSGKLDGGVGPLSGDTAVLPNWSSDNGPFASTSNASTQTDHVSGVPLAPASLLGMPTYLPPGQLNALHPYAIHQQGVPHSVPSHVPQSHVGQVHSLPAMSSVQQLQNQQPTSEGLQMSAHNGLPPSQSDQNLLGSDPKYGYEMSISGQVLRSDYLDVHVHQEAEPDSVIPSSTGEEQVLESIDRAYVVAPQSEQSLQQISSQFHDALRMNSLEQNNESKEQNVLTLTNHGLEGQSLTAEQPSSATTTLPSDASIHSVSPGENIVNNANNAVLPEAYVSTGQKNTMTAEKIPETTLLDERSLLACVVRTIPAGGRIRISSTLPNRLGKMLAPLHWHDYRKKYGKLDDLVGSHPELFVIEGDFIQLREGAQELIAATAAVAKVAAAAAAVISPYSSVLPSVAVTPMAQSYRLKKVSSMDSKHVKNDKIGFKENAVITPNATDNPLQLLAMQNQYSNGVSFGAGGGLSNIKILSKSKDSSELNGLETRHGQSSVLVTVGNGVKLDRSSLSSMQSKGSANGRPNLNFVGKQQGSTTGAASTSRR